VESAKSGDFDKIPHDIYTRYYHNIKSINKDHQEVSFGIRENFRAIWIHGFAGAGKSFAIRQMFPNIYCKRPTKWFDNYTG